MRGAERSPIPTWPPDSITDPDTELILIDRVRFAATTRWRSTGSWLPTPSPSRSSMPTSPTSLYSRLDRSGSAARAERIHPKVPTDEKLQVLDLTEGEAVFAIERLGALQGRPIEWRLTLIMATGSPSSPTGLLGQRSELRIR
ncbi:MAG: UTRA domain-containing protein [Ilumatobacteraceae bacterium]